LSGRQLLLLATLGSAGLLLGALAFQHIGGMAPCKLCIWQRYPHALAVVTGALMLALHVRWLALIGAAAALATAAVGIYHVGVEQGWWQGPSTCSAGPVEELSPDALLDQIMAAPLVRCDDIPWELFGISMAGWNALVSLALMALWLVAFRRS
jgi:disulfide bond formation protein DsbB